MWLLVHLVATVFLKSLYFLFCNVSASIKSALSQKPFCFIVKCFLFTFLMFGNSSMMSRMNHFLIRSTASSLFLLLLLAHPSFLSASVETSSPSPVLGNSSTNTITATTPVQNAEDQFRLGRAYERGEGVPQSDVIAGEWYLKAADQGNLKAMHNLGVLFLTGRGTPKDPAQGYRWIRKAADKGDAGSAYITGFLLIKGEGVTKNTAEGVGWLRKAADAGDANALARLGQDTYFGDDGITKDPKAALPLIQAAAEKGNPWACETLGLFYLHGELVPKDQQKASLWLNKGPHGLFPTAPISRATQQ